MSWLGPASGEGGRCAGLLNVSGVTGAANVSPLVYETGDARSSFGSADLRS